MSKVILVNEETYKQIVAKAKYTPQSLKINPHIPKAQAIVVDMESLKLPIVKEQLI